MVNTDLSHLGEYNTKAMDGRSFDIDGSKPLSDNLFLCHDPGDLVRLINSLVLAKVPSDQIGPTLCAYFNYMSSKAPLPVVTASVTTGESEGTTASTTSRSSRRAKRREAHMANCLAVADQEGFCYLKMIRIPRRLAVKERVGPYPDVLKLLAIPACELDLDAIATLDFERQDDNVTFHVVTNPRGGMLDVLRRSLACFKAHGDSMRKRIGEDPSDGEILSIRARVGAERKQTIVGEDKGRERSVSRPRQFARKLSVVTGAGKESSSGVEQVVNLNDELKPLSSDSFYRNRTFASYVSTTRSFVTNTASTATIVKNGFKQIDSAEPILLRFPVGCTVQFADDALLHVNDRELWMLARGKFSLRVVAADSWLYATGVTGNSYVMEIWNSMLHAGMLYGELGFSRSALSMTSWGTYAMATSKERFGERGIAYIDVDSQLCVRDVMSKEIIKGCGITAEVDEMSLIWLLN